MRRECQLESDVGRTWSAPAAVAPSEGGHNFNPPHPPSSTSGHGQRTASSQRDRFQNPKTNPESPLNRAQGAAAARPRTTWQYAARSNHRHGEASVRAGPAGHGLAAGPCRVLGSKPTRLCLGRHPLRSTTGAGNELAPSADPLLRTCTVPQPDPTRRTPSSLILGLLPGISHSQPRKASSAPGRPERRGSFGLVAGALGRHLASIRRGNSADHLQVWTRVATANPHRMGEAHTKPCHGGMGRYGGPGQGPSRQLRTAAAGHMTSVACGRLCTSLPWPAPELGLAGHTRWSKTRYRTRLEGVGAAAVRGRPWPR